VTKNQQFGQLVPESLFTLPWAFVIWRTSLSVAVKLIPQIWQTVPVMTIFFLLFPKNPMKIDDYF